MSDTKLNLQNPREKWIVIRAGEEIIGRISNFGEIDVIMSQARMSQLWQNGGNGDVGVAAYVALFSAVLELHSKLKQMGVLAPAGEEGIIIPFTRKI